MSSYKHRNIVCTLSGGFDSAAVLAELMKFPHEGYEDHVHCLFIEYGQPYLHQEYAGVVYLVNEVYGGYPNMEGLTVLSVPIFGVGRHTPWYPFRNLVIASVAANFAVRHNATEMYFGSKSLEHREGDPVSFLDSTQKFYDSFANLTDSILEPDQSRLRVHCPMMGRTKEEVLQFLHHEGIDLHRLWNCYDGRSRPCGKCHHCLETLPLIRKVTHG